MQKPIKSFITLVLPLLILTSCGGNKFKKSPVDEFIRDMKSDQVFTIILHDMDVKGTFFNDYFHKYKIIKEVGDDSKPEEEITDWIEVSKANFNTHVNNMGMEIAHRGEDGKLEKTVAPPGYSQYVGNSRYGRWENRNGTSFWAFYGQYAFMRSMFYTSTYPIQRGYYNDYNTYRNSGRTYYGPTSSNGRTVYGTSGTYTRGTRPNSSWSRNTSSFKQRVASRTSRSSASRTSRSSSRYGSSSRSSGGGYGK